MLIFFYGPEYPLNLCLILGLYYIQTNKAYIKNYCLVFSQFSVNYCSSVVSIYPLHNSITYGFIADIPEQFINIIDQLKSKWYNKIDIEVYNENGIKLIVKTYKMKNEFIKDYSKPTEEYMKDIFRTISYYWKEVKEIPIYRIKNNKIIRDYDWTVFEEEYTSSGIIRKPKHPF